MTSLMKGQAPGRGVLVAAGLFAAVLLAGCEPRRDAEVDPSTAAMRAANRLPGEVEAALANLDEVELISLDPGAPFDAPGAKINDLYLILGSTQLSGKRARRAGEVVLSSVASWDGAVAACFEPRHALRFESAGHRYLIVPCFACQSMEVYRDGEQFAGAGIAGSQAKLDRLLAAAGVPLASRR